MLYQICYPKPHIGRISKKKTTKLDVLSQQDKPRKYSTTLSHIQIFAHNTSISQAILLTQILQQRKIHILKVTAMEIQQ